MTINEIRGKQFTVGKRGYSPEEVDAFLREICTYVESLHNEKSDLLKKMEILANKIEEYRQDEGSIQDALLGAQKLGRQVVSDAKNKAAELERTSREKADQMVALAQTESEKLIKDSKQVSQELLIKAKNESQRMISEAQEKADAVYRNTRYDIEKEQAKLIRLQKETASFKTRLLDMYRQHIDLIKELPEEENDSKEENSREVRTLNKKIYEQHETAKETVKTPEPQPEAQPDSTAEEGGTVEFQKMEQPQQPKQDVLTDTVELAKEHFTKKMPDLKFGSKNQ